MDDPKQQIIDSLKQANNILVTVKNSPNIDQLAACIALTLILNDQGKHGTAVFSGDVPSVLEFLEPGKTLERNTDSLQDFIISLDKSKADKLRYKVEDSVVRIFITPYKTSITDKDLEFGQGDFNVDVVVALGVHSQDDLDQAITSHGRILHDATVISMNTEPGGSDDLGSINWTDTDSSSLSEMIAGMADSLAKEDKESKGGDHEKSPRGTVIDNQIATALLTGIVAETERFGNGKTTPATMETAAKLLTAGANQELVATKLSEPEKPKSEAPSVEPGSYEEETSNSDTTTPAMPLAPEEAENNDDSLPDKDDASNVSIYEEHHDDTDNGNMDETDDVGPIKSTDGGGLDIVHPDDQPVEEDRPAEAEAATEPVVEETKTETDNKEDHDLALSSQPLDHSDNGHPEPGLDGPRSEAVSSEEIGLIESNPERDPNEPNDPNESNEQSEAAGEKDALDLINNHKVQSALKRTVIQPLHSNHEIMAAASQEDAEAAEGIDVASSAGETEAASGTVTTPHSDNEPAPHESAANGPADSHENLAPMLTHSQPDFSQAPAAEPVPASPAAIAPGKPEGLIAPAFDMNAPVAPAAPEVPVIPAAPTYDDAPEHLIGMPAPSFTPPATPAPAAGLPSNVNSPVAPLTPTFVPPTPPPIAPPAAI